MKRSLVMLVWLDELHHNPCPELLGWTRSLFCFGVAGLTADRPYRRSLGHEQCNPCSMQAFRGPSPGAILGPEKLMFGKCPNGDKMRGQLLMQAIYVASVSVQDPLYNPAVTQAISAHTMVLRLIHM